MNFDPNNNVMKLCVLGMSSEATGDSKEAARLFWEAWEVSTNDFEKFTSAHYVARHQETIEDKLKWDKTALHFALKIKDDDTKAHLPSLHLNIGKCHEDLYDFDAAR